jgi:hypothetical protein
LVPPPAGKGAGIGTVPVAAGRAAGDAAGDAAEDAAGDAGWTAAPAAPGALVSVPRIDDGVNRLGSVMRLLAAGSVGR